MNPFIRTAVLALGSGVASVAQANLVTFDTYSPIDVQFTATSVVGLDLTFNSLTGCCAYIFNGSNPNGNGTPALIMAGFDAGDTLTITRSGGGSFDLDSLDMAISWYASSTSESVSINGNPLGITTTLTTYALNLLGVSSVTISGLPSLSGYWVIDNIVFDAKPLPEPGSLPLVALAGATMLGLASRRRTRRIHWVAPLGRDPGGAMDRLGFRSRFEPARCGRPEHVQSSHAPAGEAG